MVATGLNKLREASLPVLYVANELRHTVKLLEGNLTGSFPPNAFVLQNSSF